jgi:carbonic anhydrase
MAGNQRYVQGDITPDDHVSARARLVDGQSPHAIILRCADSRVSPEIVFDQGLGDLFVCGIAGNIPTSELVASMEYSVAILGSPLIVVMGHSSCGAVGAAVEHMDSVESLPGSLPDLISQILPAAVSTKGELGNHLDNAIKANVVNGMNRLPGMSEIIHDGLKAGTLKIVGGIYDLKSGRFNLVEG